ncbi:MAG: AzlC family ABC transporter permease, partial [Oscillospiraceae bacterium]
MKKTAKLAFTDTLPVLTGYIVLGFGFGIVLRANGYGVLWALVMSLFIYAGSMQYVAIGLLASGASLVTAALTTLMVNARHLFY